MRLQRFLAQAGIASRRKAELLITQGLVKVNGKVVTELGTKVDPRKDQVQVEGKRAQAEELVYLLLNKPKGFVTTAHDPEGRPTVMQLVRDAGVRVYPVGRLDFNTEGVLLMTNDGELAHALMHPSRGVQKTYQVKLRGMAGPDLVESWMKGVTLDDGEKTAPAQVTMLGPTEGGRNTWLEVTIHEGKNRQIHRMAEAAGFQVAKLERVRYAGLDSEAVKPGRYRTLLAREVAALRKLAGLSARAEERGAVPERTAKSRPTRAPGRERPAWAQAKPGKPPKAHKPRR